MTLALLLLLGAPPALGPPERGVVIAAEPAARAVDVVLRRLAGRLAEAGVEGVLAADLASPPIDADEQFLRARRELRRAQQAFDAKQLELAATAYDAALGPLERAVTRDAQLGTLTTALLERGALALARGDSATAETLFLRALGFNPKLEARSERIPKAAEKLLAAVREVAAKRPPAELTIDPGPIADAAVRLDFGPPLAPPFTARAAPGVHFVHVSAPDRAELVFEVAVRAGERSRLFVLPPTLGLRAERTQAVASFRPEESTRRARLVDAAAVRYLALASFEAEGIALELFDARGHAVAGGTARLGARPSDADLDAAVRALLEAAERADPELRAPAEEERPWYVSPWLIAIVSIAAAGGAAAAAIVVATGGETDYVFRP